MGEVALESGAPEGEVAPAEGAEGAEVTAEGAQEALEASKPPEPRRLKLSDDEEMDEGEAISRLKRIKELERASFKRFEEAAAAEKRLKALRESDPEEFFKERGVSPEQWAYERLQRELQMREATPEQRRILQLEQEKADWQQQQEQAKQQQEQAQFQQEVQTFRQELDKTLPPVMEKYDLPMEPETFSQVAQVMASMLRAGIPADPEFAAQRVSEVLDSAFEKRLERLVRTPGALARRYPQFAKALRESDVASVGRAPSAPRASGKPASAPSKPARQPFSFDPFAEMGVVRK